MYLLGLFSIYLAHSSSGPRPVHVPLPLSSPSGLPGPTGHGGWYAVSCEVAMPLSR